MNSSVKISIITATWNCAKTLPSCLDSVKQQTYPNREHIIIDGASKDETINIIRDNIEYIDKFISEPDTGIYDALNKGINLASGDVIGFLHSDDVYASVEILTMIARAFEDPRVCAVYGNLEYFSHDDDNKVIRRWISKQFNIVDLNWGWMPPHPTLYVRREWYRMINNFDIKYTIAADYLSILQLFSRKDFNAVYMPHVLVKMRLGGASNKSFAAILRKSIEDWHALRSCKFSFLAALVAITLKNLSKIRQFKGNPPLLQGSQK